MSPVTVIRTSVGVSHSVAKDRQVEGSAVGTAAVMGLTPNSRSIGARSRVMGGVSRFGSGDPTNLLRQNPRLVNQPEGEPTQKSPRRVQSRPDSHRFAIVTAPAS